MEPKPKMDLESECSILESVEDNGQLSIDSVPVNLGSISESKSENNGSSVVESNGHDELLKQKGADVTEYANSPPVDSEILPSTRKGNGLKKWRRIKRDAKKGGENGSVDARKMMMMTHELSNSDVSSSKRVQYAERKQKSEGSVSSTNAVVQSFNDGSPLGDLGLGLGPPFSAGTDSENSEDRSSRSSTAASAPKMNYGKPSISGFPGSRSNVISLSGKGRSETTKKARDEWVKIEKENSHSSLESDSRSSNFLFMQGTYSTNNGIRDERLKNFDGENADEAPQNEQRVADGHQGVYSGDGEEGGIADSSSEVKEDRSENHGSSSDQDSLDEPRFALQSAQEALQKEVLQIQEIGKDVSVDDDSGIGTNFLDDEQETSSNKFPGDGVHSFSRAVQSEVAETGNRDVETEVEDLFKQKIEAEVEYMAISTTVQKLRVAAADRITVLEEQKALASEQTQILDKLGFAENKAAALKKEAEKLENICEDIVTADEIMKLQKRVCKYSSCFFVQLVLLLVILGFFVIHLSPSDKEVVPT